jgi:hypothetical protein
MLKMNVIFHRQPVVYEPKTTKNRPCSFYKACFETVKLDAESTSMPINGTI